MGIHYEVKAGVGFEVFPPSNEESHYDWLASVEKIIREDWEVISFSDYDDDDFRAFIILKDPFSNDWEWNLTDRINQLRQFLIDHKQIPFEDKFDLYMGLDVS